MYNCINISSNVFNRTTLLIIWMVVLKFHPKIQLSDPPLDYNDYREYMSYDIFYKCCEILNTYNLTPNQKHEYLKILILEMSKKNIYDPLSRLQASLNMSTDTKLANV